MAGSDVGADLRVEDVENDDGSFSSDSTAEPEDTVYTVAADRAGNSPGSHRAPDVLENPGTGYGPPRRHDGQRPFLETNIDEVITVAPQEVSTEAEALPDKIWNLVLRFLPSLCITCVIQFIDLLAGVSLFLVGLVLFQAIFWPSIIYTLYSIFKDGTGILRPISKFQEGYWVHLFLLQVQAVIVVGAVLLQVLSIRYLDVTVSLAMSFLPVIVIILLEHILMTKECSVELLVSLTLGYTGVICAALTALEAPHPAIQKWIYSGVAASIGSSLLTIQGSFLLKFLRQRQVEDSLVTSTLGFHGTVLCLIIGLCLHSLGPVDPRNSGYIAAIVSFTVLATALVLIKMKRGDEPEPASTEGESSYRPRDDPGPFPTSTFTSILKLRVLVLFLSLIWGIFRQFVKHIFPNGFSILGVTLIIIAFIMAVAFREWYATVKSPEPDRKQSHIVQFTPKRRKLKEQKLRLFEFVPWLFSRRLPQF